MKPISQCFLYTFVDLAYLHGRDPAEVARQLCDGGSDLIQLRAKGAAPEQVLRLAEVILPVTESFGIGLVLNDHAAIAARVGAAACHLGQEDFFGAGFTQVSEVTGADARMRLGLSTHSPEQASRAIAAGPDYIAIGPVYATPTKPTAQPVSLDYVRWAAKAIRIPWFAIGGITLQNLEDIQAAGATRVCVVSSILESPDVAQACRHFRQRLGSSSVNRTGT